MALCTGMTRAQEIQLGDGAAATRGHVVSLSDGIEVQAGKAQDVELRFRVDAGYHINSHTPKDEYLIPTVLKLDAGAVKVLGEAYPQGSSFTLANGGGTLDVYQGEFRVRVRVMAVKGFSTMTGVLRYQACDNAACFPPRSVNVKVAVVGK